MLTVTVDSGLRLPRPGLPEAVLEDLRRRFVHRNPTYGKLRAMHRPTGAEEETLSSLVLSPLEVRVTRGGSTGLKAVLRAAGLPFQFEDRSTRAPLLRPWVYRAPFRPDPDQTAAAARLLAFRQGIVEGVCASGKTEILLMAVAGAGQRTLVCVHEEKLLRQWVRRAAERYGLGADEIGVWGGGKQQLRPFTVILQQSLVRANVPALTGEFGAYVVDEVHHQAARTFREGSDFVPAAYRFAGTATLKRKDGKSFLVTDLFGDVVYRITDDDLLRLGRIHAPTVELVPTAFEYEYKTVPARTGRGYHRLPETVVREADWTGFLTAASADPARNALALERVLRDYAAGHVSLLLTDRRQAAADWAETLRARGIECGLLLGGGNRTEKAEAERTLVRLSDRDLRVAVGTSVADEGLDVPVLDRVHLLTPTAGNPGRVRQQIGRVKRKADGKVDARAYYYWDRRIPEFEEHGPVLRSLFPGRVEQAS